MITRQGIRIAIKGPVNFGNVTKVLGEGLAEIEKGAEEVDLSMLDGADSSAISMMLEWQRAAKERSRRLSFFDMSAELEGLIRLYGLDSFFRQEKVSKK